MLIKDILLENVTLERDTESLTHAHSKVTYIKSKTTLKNETITTTEDYLCQNQEEKVTHT